MLHWIILFVIIAYTLLLVKIVLQVLVEKGSPSRTLAWVLFLLMVPGIGIFLYSVFGRNPRKERIFRHKREDDLVQMKTLLQEEFKNHNQSHLSSLEAVQKNKKLIQLLMNNGNALLTEGNQVQILNNGPATFFAIFEAIQQALSYIHIEYYIFDEGKIAHKLLRLLSQKVKEGIDVRIIYDGVGSRTLSRSFLEKVNAAGIVMLPFMPVRFKLVANKINYRNHRKIVVIDGHIGFTGGINISDKYIFGDELFKNWRDTHLRISGPAVKNLNVIFLNDWHFVSGQDPQYEQYLKPAIKSGNTPVQIIASGPDSEYANIRQEYFTLINSAESYVYITTPYFIPGEAISFALKTAALSGVDVILILPQQSDSKILTWSIQSYLEELLEAGVKIYVYQKGFLHSKIIITDDQVASVGTANVDERSFESNFEVNALIYDPTVCLELKKHFFEDLNHSEQMQLQKFRKRPRTEKLKESAARLLSPLL